MGGRQRRPIRFRRPGPDLSPRARGVAFGFDLLPDALYISDASGVHVSRDSGASWTKTGWHGLDLEGEFAAHVKVSPADPHRLACWVPKPNWQWTRYMSHDGGESWFTPTVGAENVVLPTNVRQGYYTWHPTDPDVVWSIGGDFATESTDGGQTFRWSNNGYNGVMLGHSFSISPYSPNTVLLGFQDYNGTFTHDGGSSWHYRDISGRGWGRPYLRRLHAQRTGDAGRRKRELAATAPAQDFLGRRYDLESGQRCDRRQYQMGRS